MLDIMKTHVTEWLMMRFSVVQKNTLHQALALVQQNLKVDSTDFGLFMGFVDVVWW